MAKMNIGETRVCAKCGIEKGVGEFHKNGTRNGRIRTRKWCKSCTNEGNKARRDANLEKYREIERLSWRSNFHKNGQTKRLASMKWRIIKKYGITVCEYEVMYRSQNGACAICNSQLEIAAAGRGSRRSACVDHDHVTGKVRGLLCHACNTAIGALQDDIGVIESALQYLRKHRDELYSDRRSSSGS